MKASETGFDPQALRQSLLFWRGPPPPPPPPPPPLSSSLSPSPQGQEYLKSQKKILKHLEKNEENGPHPWRYVKWRKAHEKLVTPVKEKKESRGNFYHKVLPDEDLFEVAEKYATYPEVLMEANGILNPVNVATGQVLWVPRTHSIQWGNTLWSLSQKYNVSMLAIQKANGIVNPDLIYAGDILVIPEDPDNRNAW